MENIVIGFSRPVSGFNPASWLIRLVDGTPYSHTYVVFHADSINRDLIYQASGLAVNFMGRAWFNSQDVVVKEFQISISQETKAKVLQFAIDKLGTPYGTKDVLGIGIVKLAKLLGFNIKNPFRDGDYTYVCCELVAEILTEFLGDKMDMDIQSMTPKDVYTYLSANPV